MLRIIEWISNDDLSDFEIHQLKLFYFYCLGWNVAFILLGLLLNVTWPFSFAGFCIFSLLCALDGFTIIKLGSAFSDPVWCASFIWIGFPFSRFWKFSSLVWLEIFSKNFAWDFSSCSFFPFSQSARVLLCFIHTFRKLLTLINDLILLFCLHTLIFCLSHELFYLWDFTMFFFDLWCFNILVFILSSISFY